jgi:glycosyltransferase involved in cell wall biosynthesis
LRQPLRILAVGPYPPPYTGWSTAIREESQLLRTRGHDCRVLNIGSNRRIPSADYIAVGNAFDLAGKLLMFAARGYLFRLHVNGDSVKGVLIVTLSQLIQLLGCKRSCLTFHAGADQRFFPHRRNPFLWLLWTAVFNLSRVVVCNSEEIRRRILVHRHDPNAVLAIPAFSSRRMEFEEQPLEPRVSRFLEDHEPVLFTYFAYRPEYRLDLLGPVLARLLSECPRLGVIAVDDRTHCAPGIGRQFESEIRAKGCIDRLLLLGNVDHDMFLTVLGKTDLYVRSHLRDGVCSSVLEALALGVPVVATANGDRPDPVLTYDGADGEELFEQVHRAIEKLPDLQAKVSQAGSFGDDHVARLADAIEERYA